MEIFYKISHLVKKYMKHGGIAIFDRIPQNQFLGSCDGPKIRKKCLPKVYATPLRHIIEILATKEEKNWDYLASFCPNVVFKLIISSEESIRRKSELSFNSIEEKHNIIRKLCFPNSKVFNIDAEQEIEKEILEIKEKIWNYLINPKWEH